MGTHLVIDAWQAPAELLNDSQTIREALIEAIAVGEATLIDCVHQFTLHGVTATGNSGRISSSYTHRAQIRLFCGAGKPKIAAKVLQNDLKARQSEI